MIQLKLETIKHLSKKINKFKDRTTTNFNKL